MHTSRLAAFLLAPLLAATAAAQTQPAGDLAWRLQAGDTFSYVFRWDFVQTESLGPQMVLRDVKLEVEYVLEQKVLEVDGEGRARIEATVRALKAAVDPKMMGMPMGKMSFDSAQEDAPNNFLRALREAVGKSFRFSLARDGAVTDVSGGQAIRDAVTEVARRQTEELKKRLGGGGGGMGGMMGPDLIGTLAARISVAFDDQTLASTLNVVNHVLPPDGAAEEGASWTHEVAERLPQLGALRFVGKYTRGPGEGDAARIAFRPEGKVELEKAAPGGGDGFQEQAKAGLAAMEVTHTRIRGEAFFAAGRLRSSKVEQRIDAVADIPPDSPMAGMAKPGEKIAARFELTLTYRQAN
ncbi:MAG: hypothetical protein D6731_00540 [Planctomycetota bacterium]|nr:MAG: hypothetical protein D6731_00540 [Planctomycetota bacterium]